MDHLSLHSPTHLVAARAVELAVAADGDRLSVAGPKGAARLARLLLEPKTGNLAARQPSRARADRRRTRRAISTGSSRTSP
jgi:hypothetical protein